MRVCKMWLGLHGPRRAPSCAGAAETQWEEVREEVCGPIVCSGGADLVLVVGRSAPRRGKT